MVRCPVVRYGGKFIISLWVSWLIQLFNYLANYALGC